MPAILRLDAAWHAPRQVEELHTCCLHLWLRIEILTRDLRALATWELFDGQLLSCWPPPSRLAWQIITAHSDWESEWECKAQVLRLQLVHHCAACCDF